MKYNLKLTLSQLAESVLEIYGYSNYNETDIIIHMGFENIENYFIDNILDDVLLERNKY